MFDLFPIFDLYWLFLPFLVSIFALKLSNSAKGILRIDPKSQQVTIHGDFGEGGYKWHGGVVGKTNGAM